MSLRSPGFLNQNLEHLSDEARVVEGRTGDDALGVEVQVDPATHTVAIVGVVGSRKHKLLYQQVFGLLTT